MTWTARSLLPTFAAFVFTSASSHGLGIRLQNQDPVAVARGNAFTATADNPSALYYNPAGITQLTGDNLQVGAYGIEFNVEHRAPETGQFSDTPDRWQGVPQLFYTRSVAQGRAAMGFGVYSPYGLSSEWPDGSPFRSLATKNKLVYITLNPVVAVKLTDTLSVAGGLTINYGQANLKRGIIAPKDEFRVDGEGWSYGFNAGILWQPTPQHSFGVNYRSRSHMNFEGDSFIKSTTPFFFPSSRQRASFELDFPQHIVAGYSFRPNKDWNFEFNLDWTDWDDIGELRIRQPSGDLPLIFDWRSSFVYKFGATRYLPRGFAVSAGYFYAESSTPDDNFNPAIADIDLHIFSAGFSYRSDRWSAGVAYQFGYGPETTVNGSAFSAAGQNADGRYTFVGHGIELAVGYHF